MLAPSEDQSERQPEPASPRRSIYRRLAFGGLAVAFSIWVLPSVPHDQTVVFELGNAAKDIAQLDVQWETVTGDHEGKLTLNFPAPTPERVVRQFRMKDGAYAFRITAVHRDVIPNRTELVRQVTLDGNSITLNLDELSP